MPVEILSSRQVILRECGYGCLLLAGLTLIGGTIEYLWAGTLHIYLLGAVGTLGWVAMFVVRLSIASLIEWSMMLLGIKDHYPLDGPSI